jgi:hypothetical protein
MAKKTAIELLIRELSSRKKVVEQINDVAAYEFGIAIDIAKRYLKKEAEQIEEAFNTTYGFIDGKEYYEKTFK